MRYQFMLEIDTIDEQRKKIIKLQNQLRQYGEFLLHIWLIDSELSQGHLQVIPHFWSDRYLW